jgi:hypothetical protein
MALYPYRRGDTDYPPKGNWNLGDDMRTAVCDTLRYPPPDGGAWTAHTVVCWLRDHAQLNGLRHDTYDGWDVERLIADLVTAGTAQYAEYPAGGKEGVVDGHV